MQARKIVPGRGSDELTTPMTPWWGHERLCPVSRRVNTSGGVNTGGEGMEKEFLRGLSELHPAQREAAERALGAPLVLADPMDLTKMLDVPPGTKTLPGVRDALRLFYA